MYGTVHHTVHIYSPMIWHWLMMWHRLIMWQHSIGWMRWHWLLKWRWLMKWHWLMKWRWSMMWRDSIRLKCWYGVDRWRGSMLVDQKNVHTVHAYTRNDRPDYVLYPIRTCHVVQSWASKLVLIWSPWFTQCIYK